MGRQRLIKIFILLMKYHWIRSSHRGKTYLLKHSNDKVVTWQPGVTFNASMCNGKILHCTKKPSCTVESPDNVFYLRDLKTVCSLMHNKFSAKKFTSKNINLGFRVLWINLMELWHLDGLQSIIFAADSVVIGKKINAADRSSPTVHKPLGFMQGIFNFGFCYSFFLQKRFLLLSAR